MSVCDVVCLSICSFVCLDVCQHDNWTVRGVITKFSGNRPKAKNETKLENGYIGVGDWWFNVCVSSSRRPLANDNEKIDAYDDEAVREWWENVYDVLWFLTVNVSVFYVA